MARAEGFEVAPAIAAAAHWPRCGNDVARDTRASDMTREMLELVMSISGTQLGEVKANDGRKLSGVDANTRSHTLYLLPAC